MGVHRNRAQEAKIVQNIVATVVHSCIFVYTRWSGWAPKRRKAVAATWEWTQATLWSSDSGDDDSDGEWQ